MPREQLQGLIDDVNRLLEAGATAAASDEGLRRRAAAMRKLGSRVPVLTAIADAVQRVVTGGVETATGALLDLLLVARQVHGGLAEASVPRDELQPLPPSGPWQSSMPLRELRSVLTALPPPPHPTPTELPVDPCGWLAVDLRLVPALLAAFPGGPDEMADFLAARPLPGFGPDALAALWRGLPLRGTPETIWRLKTVCRDDPKTGVELCLAALEKDSALLQQTAVSALGQLGPAARDAVSVLIERLQDRQREGRAACALALGRLGEMATDAIPALCGALRDASGPLRAAAATALVSVGRGDDRVLPAITAALDAENDGPIRQALVRAVTLLRRTLC